MGIKKIARPINKAKNLFVKWLKDENATNINVWNEGSSAVKFDYYRGVSADIGRNHYVVSFDMWKGHISISYDDGTYKHKGMGIDEFLQLID